jgi:DNA repair exonuclease SbcCD ATPase subunit
MIGPDGRQHANDVVLSAKLNELRQLLQQQTQAHQAAPKPMQQAEQLQHTHQHARPAASSISARPSALGRPEPAALTADPRIGSGGVALLFMNEDDDADTHMEEQKEHATAPSAHVESAPSAAVAGGLPSSLNSASVSDFFAAAVAPAPSASAAAPSVSASSFCSSVASLMKQCGDAVLLQVGGYEQQIASLRAQLAAQVAESAARAAELASTKQQLADVRAEGERYKDIKAEKLDAQADAQGATHQAKKVFALSEQTEAAVTEAQRERDAALKAAENALVEAACQRYLKCKAEQERDAEVKKQKSLAKQLLTDAQERQRLAAALLAARPPLSQSESFPGRPCQSCHLQLADRLCQPCGHVVICRSCAGH